MLTADGHEITKGMTVYARAGQRPSGSYWTRTLTVTVLSSSRVLCQLLGRLRQRQWNRAWNLYVSRVAARGDADGALTT